jgi:hypothetical protein
MSEDNGPALPRVLGDCAIASSFPAMVAPAGDAEASRTAWRRLPNTDL